METEGKEKKRVSERKTEGGGGGGGILFASHSSVHKYTYIVSATRLLTTTAPGGIWHTEYDGTGWNEVQQDMIPR